MPKRKCVHCEQLHQLVSVLPSALAAVAQALHMSRNLMLDMVAKREELKRVLTADELRKKKGDSND